MNYKCTGCKCSCVLEMFTESKELVMECPALLGDANWKPVTETDKPKFNIDDLNLYHVDPSVSSNVARTRKRLQEIAALGMEYFNGEFFIKGVMSGLYIERVWDWRNDEFKGYMQWVKQVIKEKAKQ